MSQHSQQHPHRHTIGDIGVWWSATEIDASNAFSRDLYYYKDDLGCDLYYYKSCGFSVRLVKDE